MRALAAILAFGLAGCAEAQDAGVAAQDIPPAPVVSVEAEPTPDHVCRADAWYAQALEASQRDNAVRREQIASKPDSEWASDESAALDIHTETRQQARLKRIHDFMLTGLTHREAVMAAQTEWHGSAEQAAYDAEHKRLADAAFPDPDPLNPGYAWRGVEGDEIAQRYGFQTRFHDLPTPEWVSIVGDAPLIEEAGETARAPFCWGRPVQGGAVACFVGVLGAIEMNGQMHRAYKKDGVVLLGFDRDAPATVRATIPQGHYNPAYDIEFRIEPREYDTSRIDGLPKNMVSEYTAEELARIRAATARKKVGFASDIDTLGFADGFILPIQTDFIKTTNFGAQRILNGEPKRPHYGVDLAAPTGTPIVAPADGIVSLSDEDMYFEGSLVMIDHGQGLISYYLHNEDVLVEEGQVVRQGEQIATVGSRGRSTGPHLCWRLKWHGQNLDPELLTEWPADG